MEYQNYVFDLYGTLIDIHTDEWAPRTWKKWIRSLDQRGIRHPDCMTLRRDFFRLDTAYRIEGKKRTECEYPEINVLDVYREMFAQYGNGILEEDRLNAIAYEFRVASRVYFRLFEGVEEYLTRIRKEGAHAYILSNAQRSYTWPEIVELKLHEMTEDQLISSDHACMKPDVRFYEALIMKHGLDKSRTVMLGDSKENDYEGARNAGLHAIHLDGENAAHLFYKRQLQS